MLVDLVLEERNQRVAHAVLRPLVALRGVALACEARHALLQLLACLLAHPPSKLLVHAQNAAAQAVLLRGRRHGGRQRDH